MPIITSIVTAIGTALGAVGSFVAGLGILGKIAIGIGLNIVAGLLKKKPEEQQAGREPVGGVQFDRQYGGDRSRSVPCGLVGLAGHDVHINTFGKSNGGLQQVYELGDYYSDGLSRVAINGEWVTLSDTAEPARGFPVTSGPFAGIIWIKFRNGRQAGADANLVAHAHPPSRWTSAYKGIGISDVIVTMTYDAETNNTFPDFFFEMRGAPLYDWRKDSTVGGSGSHRWNDTTTHEFSGNPIVMEYNYRRGFSVNGDLFCGMEMAASDLPLDKYTIAANICDENVGGQPRYAASIIFDCMATHGDNIEPLMLACGGMTIDGVDGSWPLVGSDQPTVATITDDDFVPGTIRFRALRSMGELVNAVSGTHPDPAQLWSMVDYQPQVADALVAIDRRTREVPLDFPVVTSKRQCGQLAGIYLEENRWEATAQGLLRPRWQTLKPGDWIIWDSARYGERTYLVSEAALTSLESDGPRNNQVSLQQRDGSIYDGVLDPPILTPFGPGLPDYANEAQDFDVTAITVQGSGHDLRPAFLAEWGAFDDLTVVGLDIRYWPSDQPATVFLHPRVPRDQTITPIVAGVLSLKKYKFQTRIITSPRRQTVWSTAIERESLSAPTTDILVALGHIADDLRDYLEARKADFDLLVASFALYKANQLTIDAADVVERQSYRKDFGDLSASFSHEVALRADQYGALAQEQTVLQSSLSGALTAITGNSTAIANMQTSISTINGQIVSLGSFNTSVAGRLNTLEGQQAADASAFDTLNQKVVSQAGLIQTNAENISGVRTDIGGLNGTIAGQGSAIQALTVNVNALPSGAVLSVIASNFALVQAQAARASAAGLVGWTVSARPAGVLARYTIQGKVTAAGANFTGGMFLDITSAGSQFVFDAGQFMIFDGGAGAKFLPFVFSGGVARLGAIKVGSANIDNAAILRAHIGLLEVDSIHIRNGAIARHDVIPGSLTGKKAPATLTVASKVISNPSASAVMIDFSGTISLNVSGSLATGQAASTTAVLRVLRNGAVISTTVITASATTGNPKSVSGHQFTMDRPPAGNSTYLIQLVLTKTGGNASASCSATAQLSWTSK